jgi:hypothetical protein
MAVKKKKAKKAKKSIKKSSVSRKRTKSVKPKRRLAKAKKLPPETPVGKVTHYFPMVEAAVIKITKDKISLGDNLHIKGHSTDFTQTADSIQIDRVPVKSAKKGQEIGLKVASRVRENDLVYRA